MAHALAAAHTPSGLRPLRPRHRPSHGGVILHETRARAYRRRRRCGSPPPTPRRRSCRARGRLIRPRSPRPSRRASPIFSQIFTPTRVADSPTIEPAASSRQLSRVRERRTRKARRASRLDCPLGRTPMTDVRTKRSLVTFIGTAALLLAMPAAARADTPWSIGAAKVDTTPPAFDAAQDLRDFPEVDTARGITCPRAVYNGPRLWRFEAPHQDTDGPGDLNYPGGTAEPFCDYNHNGRWEGIYLSGGIDQRAKFPHDPIDARAIAVTGDNDKTIALVSVVAQGIFENYIAEARAKAEAL